MRHLHFRRQLRLPEAQTCLAQVINDRHNMTTLTLHPPVSSAGHFTTAWIVYFLQKNALTLHSRVYVLIIARLCVSQLNCRWHPQFWCAVTIVTASSGTWILQCLVSFKRRSYNKSNFARTNLTVRIPKATLRIIFKSQRLQGCFNMMIIVKFKFKWYTFGGWRGCIIILEDLMSLVE